MNPRKAWHIRMCQQWLQRRPIPKPPKEVTQLRALGSIGGVEAWLFTNHEGSYVAWKV